MRRIIVSEFNVTIVEYPAKRLTGIKVRSNMAKAQEDCPALWQRFCTDYAQVMPTASYGVTVMANAEDFDYWAAVEDKDGRLPDDLKHVDIPAGKYAVCSVPSLASIGEAYMFIFQNWFASQQTYAYDEQSLSFELYPSHWSVENPFEIYVGIKG
jgi:AraC family transcriptional regulator